MNRQVWNIILLGLAAGLSGAHFAVRNWWVAGVWTVCAIIWGMQIYMTTKTLGLAEYAKGLMEFKER